ncbi:YhfC family glutamic-type intramembrane protease [Thermococcus sp. 21S7]|uniref:YhfC family glutamic-type intramembrane protease n=1 Tax=Thermococcus sp. 21S7 TaxID=1638221 RepID=UPI0014391D1D|nr:YhfC family glutamic-type intramembrane protease [Thermococcus sp. 21S7]NJE61514.1 YhfC family intramembrane metalloprotease [Thermococcus sp. 21S7]
MYLLPFPILGGLLAWATIYSLGFDKQRWGEFVLGLAAFFIAIIIQNPVQQLPLLGVGIKSNADIIARGTAFTVGVSIWLGLIAGIAQEGAKYLLVKGKSLNTGLFLGLGFGITEVFVIAGAALAGALATGEPLDVPLSAALASMVERYFVVLFHVGTGIYLAYAYREGYGRTGLLAMIGIHTVIDSMAAYYQLTKSTPVMYAVEFITALVALGLLYHTIPKAKLELPEEEAALW